MQGKRLAVAVNFDVSATNLQNATLPQRCRTRLATATLKMWRCGGKIGVGADWLWRSWRRFECRCGNVAFYPQRWRPWRAWAPGKRCGVAANFGGWRARFLGA